VSSHHTLAALQEHVDLAVQHISRDIDREHELLVEGVLVADHLEHATDHLENRGAGSLGGTIHDPLVFSEEMPDGHAH
jgi:hypothetical protein